MSDAYCSDCKRQTEVVFDHSAGDTVCSECGLVLESHSIDETSEWRTFANESGDNDPVRVGGPTNPLLADGGLSTVIAKPNGASGEFLSSSLGRWQNRGSNPDRGLILAFKTIATMSDRLGLVATIKDRANEIYKRVEDQKSSRGRNQDALLAACLYIACRQEDKPRTVKEICSVANGASKKEIGRAKEYIVKQLGLEKGQSVEMGTIHAGDFMRRFCSNLGMNNQAVKAAQEAVQKSEEFDIRRSPISIAAAVIYIITQLSDDKKPLKDISVATGVAEGTIRNSYKDLYPHVSKIIPNCQNSSSLTSIRVESFLDELKVVTGCSCLALVGGGPSPMLHFQRASAARAGDRATRMEMALASRWKILNKELGKWRDALTKARDNIQRGQNLGNEHKCGSVPLVRQKIFNNHQCWEVMKNCSRFKIIPTGPTVVLNETSLHNSTTLDSPLDFSMNQDSPIQKEPRPIGRKAAKANRGSKSTNDTAKILEQIALNGTMRIERDMKRDLDERTMYEEFARERE
ncbi:unnamed protein product [Prunus armeniaca]|uniref:TFIIB-type domain-containing protein n=1 Tax=Prunus armeniaca TaxID=36596 RepID=A0A6J5Y0Q9_PRUAR|nr:unnamed protein product [Prunus armeniaca]